MLPKSNAALEKHIFLHYCFIQNCLKMDAESGKNGSRDKIHEKIAPGSGLFKEEIDLGTIFWTQMGPKNHEKCVRKSDCKKC